MILENTGVNYNCLMSHAVIGMLLMSVDPRYHRYLYWDDTTSSLLHKLHIITIAQVMITYHNTSLF